MPTAPTHYTLNTADRPTPRTSDQSYGHVLFLMVRMWQGTGLQEGVGAVGGGGGGGGGGRGVLKKTFTANRLIFPHFKLCFHWITISARYKLFYPTSQRVSKLDIIGLPRYVLSTNGTATCKVYMCHFMKVIKKKFWRIQDNLLKNHNCIHFITLL